MYSISFYYHVYIKNIHISILYIIHICLHSNPLYITHQPDHSSNCIQYYVILVYILDEHVAYNIMHEWYVI